MKTSQLASAVCKCAIPSGSQRVLSDIQLRVRVRDAQDSLLASPAIVRPWESMQEREVGCISQAGDYIIEAGRDHLLWG